MVVSACSSNYQWNKGVWKVRVFLLQHYERLQFMILWPLVTTSPKIDGVRKMAERSQVGELWLKSSRHGDDKMQMGLEHRHWSDRPDAIYPDAFPDPKIYRTPFLRFAVFLGEILKETWFQSPAGAVEDGDVWAGEESWWRKFPLWSKHIMEVS